LKDALDESDIFVICYSSTVVDISSQEIQHFVRNFLISIKESLELDLANIEFLIHKGIRDIPSNSSELSSILSDSMEEAEGEQKHFVFFWLGAIVQVSVIHISIRSQQV
jgi:hypothetical protein